MFNTFNLVLNTTKYNRNNHTLEFSLENKKGFDCFKFYMKFKFNPIKNKFDLKDYFLDLKHDVFVENSSLYYKNGILHLKHEDRVYDLELNNLSISNYMLNRFITSIIRYRFEIERIQNMEKNMEENYAKI